MLRLRVRRRIADRWRPASSRELLHRMGAMPVGVGLAWLGYALWSERRDLPIDAVTAAALPQQNLSQAASPGLSPPFSCIESTTTGEAVDRVQPRHPVSPRDSGHSGTRVLGLPAPVPHYIQGRRLSHRGARSHSGVGIRGCSRRRQSAVPDDQDADRQPSSASFNGCVGGDRSDPACHSRCSSDRGQHDSDAGLPG